MGKCVERIQLSVMDKDQFLGVIVLSVKDPNTCVYWTGKFLKRRGIFVQDSQKIDTEMFDRITAALENANKVNDQTDIIEKDLGHFARWITVHCPEPII